MTPTFQGFGGVEEWVDSAPDNYHFVKIYNGKFVKRGQGKPLASGEFSSKQDVLDYIYSQLSNVQSGMFTISLNSRASGGGDGLTRFLSFGPLTSSKVSGTSNEQATPQMSIGQIEQMVIQKAQEKFDAMLERHKERMEFQAEIDYWQRKSKKRNASLPEKVLEMLDQDPEKLNNLGTMLIEGATKIAGITAMMLSNKGVPTQVAVQSLNHSIQNKTVEPTKDKTADTNADIDTKAEEPVEMTEEEQQAYEDQLNALIDKIEQEEINILYLLGIFVQLLDTPKKEKVKAFLKDPDKLNAMFALI